MQDQNNIDDAACSPYSGVKQRRSMEDFKSNRSPTTTPEKREDDAKWPQRGHENSEQGHENSQILYSKLINDLQKVDEEQELDFSERYQHTSPISGLNKPRGGDDLAESKTPKSANLNNGTSPIMICVWIAIGVVVLGIVIGFVNLYYTDTTTQIITEDELRRSYYRSITDIQHDFPSQINDIWREFFVGIKKVMLEQPTNPSIFLLIHHDHEITTSCLALKVGEVARGLMNATKSSPLILDGKELSKNEKLHPSNGYWFIDEYKSLVEAHRIMIMNNLQMLPATYARSLHSFCDTDTPLVDKAIYIFTMNVPGRWGSKENPTKVAESELEKVWGDLEGDVLLPLIIRVTGGSVLKVEEESRKLPC